MADLATTDFVVHAKRRAWFVALQAILALVGVVLVLAVRDETTYSRTTHFVLHPDSSVPPAQVPQAIDVLGGSVVQTVLRVLNSGEILERSAAAAHLADTSGTSLDATVQPGSAYFDATVRGDDQAAVNAVSRAFTGVASRYVDRSYKGYTLETLGASTATEHSFPPSPAVATLSLLLGALVGVGLVFVEWVAHRPPFAVRMPQVAATATATPAAAVPAEAAISPPVVETAPIPPKRATRATGATAKRSGSSSTRARKSQPKAATAPRPGGEASIGQSPRKPRSSSTRAKKTSVASSSEPSPDPAERKDEAARSAPAANGDESSAAASTGPATTFSGDSGAPESVPSPTGDKAEETAESAADASISLLDERRRSGGNGREPGHDSTDGESPATSSELPAK